MNIRFLMAIVLFFGLISSNAFASYSDKNDAYDISKLKYGDGKIVVGSVGVSYTESIFLMPDTVEFSITYITEGTTPNDASNQNIKNMKELTKYFTSLGIKESDLVTISYKNHENIVQEAVTNESMMLHETKLGVNFVIAKNNYYEVINMLEKNGVGSLLFNDRREFYVLNIVDSNQKADLSKESVQKSYDMIKTELTKLGVTNIRVDNYDTKIISPINKDVKKYYVSNTVKIKTTNFKDLGKIISKAQELKMNINNDMKYTVSDSIKNKAINEHESKIFEKLLLRAKRVAQVQNYKIGVPSNLNLANSGVIYPYTRYNTNYDSDVINNIKQNQLFTAEEVTINTPSEFEVTLTISGTFELIQDIVK